MLKYQKNILSSSMVMDGHLTIQNYQWNHLVSNVKNSKLVMFVYLWRCVNNLCNSNHSFHSLVATRYHRTYQKKDFNYQPQQLVDPYSSQISELTQETIRKNSIGAMNKKLSLMSRWTCHWGVNANGLTQTIVLIPHLNFN